MSLAIRFTIPPENCKYLWKNGGFNLNVMGTIRLEDGRRTLIETEDFIVGRAEVASAIKDALERLAAQVLERFPQAEADPIFSEHFLKRSAGFG